LSIGRLGDVKRIGAALRRLKSMAETQTKQQLYNSTETNGGLEYSTLDRRCSRWLVKVPQLEGL
jgi:hypothetical protein